MMNDKNAVLREFGEFRLDANKKVLWFAGEPVNLALKEIELLCALTERGGEVLTKNELLEKVWAETFVEESNLTRHIHVLRKTLKEFGTEDFIKTVPRRGYRFAGAVREIPGGEFVIEKHTRTRTVIEIEEEKRGRKSFFLFSSHFLLFSISLLLLLVGALAVYQNLPVRNSAGEIKSIAVLPFKTIDEKKENAHQGLGLADVLITRLSRVTEISVRPISAVANFENQEQDSIGFGKKLEADAVLEGTIYRADGKIRITARLVKIADGAVVWSGQFEKFAANEFKLPDEIASQVTDALALNLSAGEKDSLTKRHTENPDAYQLYLRGRYEWNKRTWAGMSEAERLFRNAIERDPKFALAYIGLADSMLMNSANTVPATAAAQKALELDPLLAEAYATLGFLNAFHYWQWREAETALKRSIELNPNYATAHHWLAQVLAIQGKMEEAKTALQRALEINPTSHNFLADLGQIYYFSREYKEAEEYCRRALEIYPDFVFAHEYLFKIYLQTGDYDRAVAESLAADKITSTFANQSAEYQKRIEAISDERKKNYREGGIKRFLLLRVGQTPDGNICYVTAAIYTFLNEKEKALNCLEMAYEDRSFLSAFVKADPVFDSLRQEPRYQEILRKMNLR